jgi:hypothetical protein
MRETWKYSRFLSVDNERRPTEAEEYRYMDSKMHHALSFVSIGAKLKTLNHEEMTMLRFLTIPKLPTGGNAVTRQQVWSTTVCFCWIRRRAAHPLYPSVPMATPGQDVQSVRTRPRYDRSGLGFWRAGLVDRSSG